MKKEIIAGGIIIPAVESKISGQIEWQARWKVNPSSQVD